MLALPWSVMSHKQFPHSEISHFLTVHKALLLTGLRKENSTSLLANSIPSYATNPCLSAQLWCSPLLQEGWSSARAGLSRVILFSGGSPPTNQGFHIFQSLQLTAWHLNCHGFHSATIDKAVDGAAAERVSSTSSCPGGHHWRETRWGEQPGAIDLQVANTNHPGVWTTGFTHPFTHHEPHTLRLPEQSRALPTSS